MAANTSNVVVVIGGGLAGSMMALMLAKRGFNVEVYEKRPDIRLDEQRHADLLKHLGMVTDPTKRSINLAISHRGQTALEAVGCLDAVMRQVVPMPCRAMHAVDGTITTQPYGTGSQSIYSASRTLLLRVLSDAGDAYPNLRVHYECSLKGIAFDGTLTFIQNVAATSSNGSGSGSSTGTGAGATADATPTSTTTTGNATTRTIVVPAPLAVIGADGAFSATREAMLRLGRMNFNRKFLEHAYKELNIPPTADGHWALPLPHHALHIWPRKQFMMIALPNPDHTFTATLFLPWQDLERLDNDITSVRPFFETYFPDVLPVIPELEKQFAKNPTSALMMVRCTPWNHEDKIVLIGDAAHATVPFYGQGAMAAFEDCMCLSEELDKANNNIGHAIRTFAASHQPAGEALLDLSLANYIEMRDKTASMTFLWRKKVEAWLHWLFPTLWIPQYTMVAFTRIPYDQVMVKARRQDTILTWIVRAALSGLSVGFAAAVCKWVFGTSLRAVLRRALSRLLAFI